MKDWLFKRLATAAVALTACLSASVAFAAPPAPSPGDPGDSPTNDSLGNSRHGSAVLEASNIAPGESRSATVTITNRDRVAASFSVATYGLREQPGKGGGMLSDTLELRLDDVADQRSPATLYVGALRDMSSQALGTFMPGESRTYRFTVTFTDRPASPRAGFTDNAYMGGSLSLGFLWRSSQ